MLIPVWAICKWLLQGVEDKEKELEKCTLPNLFPGQTSSQLFRCWEFVSWRAVCLFVICGFPVHHKSNPPFPPHPQNLHFSHCHCLRALTVSLNFLKIQLTVNGFILKMWKNKRTLKGMNEKSFFALMNRTLIIVVITVIIITINTVTIIIIQQTESFTVTLELSYSSCFFLAVVLC